MIELFKNIFVIYIMYINDHMRYNGSACTNPTKTKTLTVLLVLPVMVAPLATEVLYASDGVLHQLRTMGGSLDTCKDARLALRQPRPAWPHPAVDFHVDGAHVAVGSADVDELDQRSNADSLRGREQSTGQ